LLKLLQILTERLLKMPEEKLLKLLELNIAVKTQEQLIIRTLWPANTNKLLIKELELLPSMLMTKLKMMFIMLNGSPDTIDQTGHKQIQKLGLPHHQTDLYLKALSNQLLMLLLSKKLKKPHPMPPSQNHKLMLLLQLSIRKRTSFTLEWIKLEVKLKNLEIQEDGDLFGQSTLLPNLQKTLIKLKLLLLKALLMLQKFKDLLKLRTLLMLPHLMLMLLMVLLKLNWSQDKTSIMYQEVESTLPEIA
jgi:hypothetical protein